MHGYREKISAIPMITIAAPTHAPAAGRCPVRSQINGNMITGEVAESVDTMPTLPPESANNSKVMPTASARNPLSAVMAALPMIANSHGLNATENRLIEIVGTC